MTLILKMYLKLAKAAQKKPYKNNNKNKLTMSNNRKNKLKTQMMILIGNLIFIVYIVVFEVMLKNSIITSFKRLRRVFLMLNVLENQIQQKQELEH